MCVRRLLPEASALLARPILVIVGLFALSRAVLLTIGHLATFTMATPELAELGDGSLMSLLCRWDCGWYLGIATEGYSIEHDTKQAGATNLAFYPVFPLLMEGIHRLLGIGHLAAGIMVSNLAFLGALVYVYRYSIVLGFSATTGLLSVALLCFVPQSFVFSAVYTESVFMLLLAAAMYHLRLGHFLLAGLLAAILSAVRANGIFFIFFALFWVLRTYGPGAFLKPWRQPEIFIPIVLAPLGLFCFWAYSFALAGDAFAQTSSSSHGWGWQSGFFIDNLASHLRFDDVSRFWALSSMAVFAVSLLLLRYGLWEEFGLCLLVFLLLWSSQLPNSLLRYTIVLFPIWIAFAHQLERRPIAIASVFAAMAVVNGFLMTAWTLGKLISI
jgi:hypothetical protein